MTFDEFYDDFYKDYSPYDRSMLSHFAKLDMKAAWRGAINACQKRIKARDEQERDADGSAWNALVEYGCNPPSAESMGATLDYILGCDLDDCIDVLEDLR